MERQTLTLLDDPSAARLALSPIRREMLAIMDDPVSASGLAATLGQTRQKIGYHLKALEGAGLVAPAGERRRRGFTEKLYVSASGSLLIDPAIMRVPSEAEAKQDRHAAGYLISGAAGMARDVARMQTAAGEADKRLLTFTIEAEVGFERPSDMDRFAADLAEAVHALGKRYAPEGGGRRYRVFIGGHPAPGGGEPPRTGH